MELIMNTNIDLEKYQRVRKQVEEIKGFYSHLLSYVLVIGVLIFINLKYSAHELWFLWAATGWGIGLFSHGNKVFSWLPSLGKDWEQKKLQQFIKEENEKSTKD